VDVALPDERDELLVLEGPDAVTYPVRLAVFERIPNGFRSRPFAGVDFDAHARFSQLVKLLLKRTDWEGAFVTG
jgi:hypothetical protein